MLNAMRTTLVYIQAMPVLTAIGWAAGRRGDHVVVAIDADQSDYGMKRALLEALTDEEYAAFEASLPLSEQERRVELTAGWPHLSRREAMLAHLDRFDDRTYDWYMAALPESERERRRSAIQAGRWDSGHPPALAFA